jgi:hypothetical protein
MGDLLFSSNQTRKSLSYSCLLARRIISQNIAKQPSIATPSLDLMKPNSNNITILELMKQMGSWKPGSMLCANH